MCIYACNMSQSKSDYDNSSIYYLRCITDILKS